MMTTIEELQSAIREALFHLDTYLDKNGNSMIDSNAARVLRSCLPNECSHGLSLENPCWQCDEERV